MIRLLLLSLTLSPALAQAEPKPEKRECSIYRVEKRSGTHDVDMIRQGVKKKETERLEVVIESSPIHHARPAAEALVDCVAKARAKCSAEEVKMGFCRVAVHPRGTPTAFAQTQVVAPEPAPKKKAAK